ncbi:MULTISPECIES: DUF4374 domain-containing protein [Chitinophagaceae]
MKKNRFWIGAAASAILLLSACSKNDNNPPSGGDSTGVVKPKEGVFVLSGRSSPYAGADVLYTASSLDSGTLITQGTGVEQDGTTFNYAVNNGMLFSLLFNQGNPGAVTIYQPNAEKKLTQIAKLQTETMTCYGNVGTDLLLTKNAWQVAENYTQWYRLDSKTQQIVGQGEINAADLAGNGDKAFFTDILKVEDKVFASFWKVESGLTFATTSPDSNWIAVYDYPGMQLQKVIGDSRTGAIGALMTRGLDLDENEDVYALGTMLDYDKSKKYSTNKPVAFLKIKKGTTEYDKSYFLNVSDLSGGQYVYKKNYLGKGYFLLTMCPKPYIYATPFYGALIYGGLKLAVVNVYDGSFKWVSGVPDSRSIQSTSGDANYSALDGTGYIGLYYTENDAAKSAVFKIDGPTATAKIGLATDGKAAITGIYYVQTN